jgi:beta-N-acetylhexosaminidase
MGEQTSLADRKRRAGQRLVLGFAGPSVDDDLRKLVQEIQPAGFILFARNVEEPAQVRELNRELASLVDAHHPALLTVDQEGGRVARVREPATVWPAMRDVANADVDIEAIGHALGTELRAMGFHVDFAPVADVDSNPDNPVIGDRSFGRDPHAVAKAVVAMTRGLQSAGIAACAKHFPGHGDTHLDSHVALPVVEEELPRLQTREFVPFQAAVRAGIASIMSAHVVFPEFDEDLPATLSPRILPEILRRQMGFGGVVFSDDMEMKAVHGRWPVDQLAELTTRASVDLLLCCEDPGLQIEMYQAMVRLQESERGMDDAFTDSLARVHTLRERLFHQMAPQPSLDVLGCMAHRMLAETVRQRVG